MKKAIGYTRISTNDQSNFSIAGQESTIREHCQKNNFELVAMFCDDGESARNFDRPDWIQLEKFIIKNYRQVDYLVVIKYDRFIRNTLDGLKMIEQLELQYNIRIVSIMEPIMMHPQSPYYFKIRADILTSGHFERLVIADRTKFGIHHANKQGRYVSTAPIGYVNARDEKNKPILLVEPARAELIKQIFSLFLQGYRPEEIRRQLKPAGLTLTGKSAIQRVLANPTYAGLIRMREYYDEPESLVKGIHQAIIPEETFFQVQDLINKPAILSRRKLSEDFPLRGVLKHHCGRTLTAAFSKGKNRLIGYYRCHGDNANLNSNKLHEQFEGILKELSLQQHHLDYIKYLWEQRHIEQMQGQQQLLSKKRTELQGVTDRLNNLEEKLLDGTVDSTTYKKWHSRLFSAQSILEASIRELRNPGDSFGEQSEKIQLLGNVAAVYHNGSPADKLAFVRGVFNNQLSHDGNIYRTPYLFSLFRHKALALKEKGLLVFEQPGNNLAEIEESTPEGFTIEHFHDVLSLFAAIKIA